LAGELGVEIHTGCAVEQIAVRDGAVRGLRLSDGTEIPARAVIANTDVTTVYEKLLPPQPTFQARAVRLAQQEPSCSGFIMLLGVRGQHDGLAHHNLFFADDYRREFAQIFADGQPPDAPSIYLAITSKTDADHAPPGGENWFVLVNAPAADGRFDWAARADEYGAHVLERLAHFGYDVRDTLDHTQIITPLDLERMNGARRGALYGASSNDRFAAFRRPHNRAPGVRGLYFAGGTTHPGGGVPMVALSGKVAAELALENLNGRR
jgi:phytoene desaturase